MDVTRAVARAAGLLAVSLALCAQSAPEVRQKVAALEREVQKYLQAQKPQSAIPVLREIVALDPKNLNAQGNLGVLLSFQGEYAEAIPHMRAALAMQPELWRIAALLGIAEKRAGNLKAAQAELERAFPKLDEQKIQVDAGLELIEIYSATGELDKALQVAVRLGALAPENPRILLVTHHISRQIMDRSLLTLMMAAPDAAETHMVVAGELARQGDAANAIAQYREAIRLNPRLPGAHFELAERLRLSPDPALSAEAEAEYRAAIEVNPFDELSWRQLGGVLAAKGDHAAAEESYKKALTLQPKDADAKTGLAIALISLNRTGEAVTLLESALQDDPTNIVAHYRLSGLYRRAGRTADAEREMAAFQRYNELKEKLGKVYKQLGGQNGPM